jgi:peptidoglycan/LPS O-acetylase OafA/YrhL
MVPTDIWYPNAGAKHRSRLTTQTQSASPSGKTKDLPWNFRGDIEGLRGAAVLLVLGFHAGVPGVAGGYVGVDVFFVISGFLITGLLWRELSDTGAISFSQFYTRRIRRLLPAAGLVLIATAAAILVLIPFLDWPRFGWDITSAAAYVSNFRFALDSTDYLAAELAQSPVLQYWSLSVEEQFYLIWPIALVGLWAIARRIPAVKMKIMAGGLAVIAVLSLAATMVLTTSAQPWAFFMMPTRAWEFAVGGLVALWLMSGRKTPRGLGLAAGWLGIVAVLTAGAVFSISTAFPGTAALLPVLGTGALLLAGAGYHRWGVSSALRVSWLRAIGRISYAWYLWHWPFLVIGAVVFGSRLDLWQSVALVGLSWVPAYLTYRFVENPIRAKNARTAVGPFSTRRGAAVLGASVTGAAIAAGLMLTSWPSSSEPSLSLAQEGSESVADLRTDPAAPTSGKLTPTIADARDDIPKSYPDGCHLQVLDTVSGPCEYGDPSGARRVILWGDSHAAQWLPALHKVGVGEGWVVVNRAKSSCPLGGSSAVLDKPFNRAYTECKDWLATVQVEIAASPPDLVIVSGYQPTLPADDGAGQPEVWSQAMAADLAMLSQTGTSVIVLGDTPYMGIDVPTCLAKAGTQNQACSKPRADVQPNSADRIAANIAEVPYLNMSDSICGADLCEAIRFGRVVWRDQHHLTASYAAALSDVLRQHIDALAPAMRPIS